MHTTAPHPSFVRTAMLAVTALAALAAPALAGPPLLCHPFDIGTAASLPWSGATAWYQGQPGYNIQRLPADTTALLTPSTPIIVRMETLRRAAIYASNNPQAAKRLFLAVSGRASAAGGATDPLALFDAGYLTETFNELGRLASYDFTGFSISGEALAALTKDVDGYALVQQSQALRPNDPAIDLASALIASSSRARKAQYASHAARARAGGTRDPLLARNLSRISN